MSEACKEIQDQIAGYVDQEIEPGRASSISQHLHRCPGCAQQADTQKEVKQWVQENAPHVAAPPHLRGEVRRRLDREPFRFGFLGALQYLFQQKPLPATAATIGLIVLSSFITYYSVPGRMHQNGGTPGFVDVSLEGEMVCVDCTLMDIRQAQYTHDATHRFGLRCKNGNIWSILPSEKGRELMQHPGCLQRQVRIVGYMFQNTHYIEVKEFSLI
jgi:mycothiol system anti-sigma-R factor